MPPRIRNNIPSLNINKTNGLSLSFSTQLGSRKCSFNFYFLTASLSGGLGVWGRDETKNGCQGDYNKRQTCWDTVLKWGKLGEQKNPHPFTLSFKAGFTIFPTGSSNGLPVARICIFAFWSRKLPQFIFILSSVVVAQEQEENVSKNSLSKQTDDETDIGEADQENWKEPSLEWFY